MIQWKTTLLACLFFSLMSANVFATESQKIDMSSTKKITNVWDGPHEIRITTVRKIQSSSSDTSKSKDIFVLTVKIVTDDALLQSWLSDNLDKAYLVSTIQSSVLDMQTLIYEYAISFFQTNPNTWLINVPMQNLCTSLKNSDVYPAYEVCLEGSFTSENKEVNEIHCLNMNDKNVIFDKGTMAFTSHVRYNEENNADRPLIGNMPDVCSTLHQIDPSTYINLERKIVVYPLEVVSTQ